VRVETAASMSMGRGPRGGRMETGERLTEESLIATAVKNGRKGTPPPCNCVRRRRAEEEAEFDRVGLFLRAGGERKDKLGGGLDVEQ